MYTRNWNLPEATFFMQYRGAFNTFTEAIHINLRNYELDLFGRTFLPDYGKHSNVSKI